MTKKKRTIIRHIKYTFAASNSSSSNFGCGKYMGQAHKNMMEYSLQHVSKQQKFENYLHA